MKNKSKYGNESYYENQYYLDINFPVIFRNASMTKTDGFSCHWHKEIELLYFYSGEAIIKCNLKDMPAKKGDLIVINSNELHQGSCVIEPALYHCILFDTSLLENLRMDACEVKYLNAINQNRIIFQNRVQNDRKVAEYINEFINEMDKKKTGYELAVKAAIYNLIVRLLRNYVKVTLSQNEYNIRVRNLKKFNIVFEYIEEHFNEKISIDGLCRMVNLSRCYFCRAFKNMTGKSLSNYINQVRVNKAAAMLEKGTVNVTEAALACGFEDVNYFSRVFKSVKNVSPSSILKKPASMGMPDGNTIQNAKKAGQ